jgi:hypothetical protein
MLLELHPAVFGLIFGAAGAFFRCTDKPDATEPRDRPVTEIATPSNRPSNENGLRIFIKRQHARPMLLRPDDFVSAGDTIQAAYRTSGKHMLILSVDGNGQVTLHYPESKPCATRVEPAQRFIPLHSAFELDNAPSFEHFFLVVSDEPLSIEALTAWFRNIPYPQLADTTLPGGARIAADFRLKKR